MKLRSYLYIIVLATLLSACSEDYLEKSPISEVTTENFFKTASDLKLYTNGFYRMLPHTSIYNGDSKADNIVQNLLSDEMRGTRTIPTSGGGWNWNYLRDINFFLEHYQNVSDEAVKNHYAGVARFFRAYFYFDKLKRFGGVPWYDQTIDPEDKESLLKPRDSRQFIVDKILEDLNWAIAHLNSEQKVYEITKYTALALKSRVGLYEGTYEKYRGIEGYETYLQAAIDASEELINNSPYTVYSTGNPQKDYLELFNAHAANPTAFILARQYSSELNINHNVNYYTTTGSYGMPGMPKDLVNSYLNTDGSRFTDQPNYNSISFVEEVQNRDPRLAQTIRTPGYTRKGTTTALAPNLGATVTGYQLIKYVTEPEYDTYNEALNDLPLFRIGEVLLNYAEAKAELNQLTQQDLDLSINQLRMRVNMPPLQLSQANGNPDPFMADQYPQVQGNNKGVILEIRRERRIELFMENFRWDDLVRWKAGQTMTDPIYGMYFPGSGSYDLTDDGQIDIVLYSGDTPSNQTPGVQYYKLGEDITLSPDGLIAPHPNFARQFQDFEYLYPLPRVELQLNPNLEQNPGW